MKATNKQKEHKQKEVSSKQGEKTLVEMESYNVNLIRDMYDALDDNNRDFIDQILARNVVIYMAGFPDALNKRTFQKMSEEFYLAFPDYYNIIEDIFAHDDKVVIRLTFSGTHQNQFMGIEPTGLSIEFTGIHIWQIKEGHIVKGWVQEDLLTLMSQLGVKTEPEKAA